MRYSFVIPTYNNKYLLKNTLEALNYQEGFGPEDYEVIIADDGSSDGTEEYIKGVNKNYSINHYYLERCMDSSRSRTRNYGWRKATGDIIVFIDSDIIVQKNYLKELSRCFSVREDLTVIGNRLMLAKDINFEDIKTEEVFKQNAFDSKNYQMLELRYFHFEKGSYNSNALFCPWLIIYSCNLAIPRTALEAVGGFDENYKGWGLEDLDIGYALFKKGLQIVINSKLEVLHQFHGKANDFIIDQNSMSGYEKNIDYFLLKYPEALGLTNSKAYKFLKGQFSMDLRNIDPSIEVREIAFQDRTVLNTLKEQLLTLTQNPKVKVILYDYVEDTDLDLWIQLLGRTRSTIKYHPMSRKIDSKKMKDYMRQIRKDTN